MAANATPYRGATKFGCPRQWDRQIQPHMVGNGCILVGRPDHYPHGNDTGYPFKNKNFILFVVFLFKGNWDILIQFIFLW